MINYRITKSWVALVSILIRQDNRWQQLPTYALFKCNGVALCYNNRPVDIPAPVITMTLRSARERLSLAYSHPDCIPCTHWDSLSSEVMIFLKCVMIPSTERSSSTLGLAAPPSPSTCSWFPNTSASRSTARVCVHTCIVLLCIQFHQVERTWMTSLRPLYTGM